MFQSAIAFLETQGVSTPFATAIIRLLLGSICGGLIGLEREMKGRPAGLKTFSLVCMGATLVMVTNEFIYVNVANSTGDSARMAAQVISGIGFLGAGTIMTTGNDRVKGLTTAAALWVTAAIGIAIGTGFYFGGIAGLIVLYAVPAIGRKILLGNLAAFQRLTGKAPVGGKADACTVLAQVQVFVAVDKIDCFFFLFHQ